MLLGFTGFYRVLPGFTGFYLVMPSLGRKERGQGVILVNERDSDGANDCDNNGGIKRKRRRAVAASRTGRRGAGAGRRPTFFFPLAPPTRPFLSLSLSLSLYDGPEPWQLSAGAKLGSGHSGRPDLSG